MLNALIPYLATDARAKTDAVVILPKDVFANHTTPVLTLDVE